MPFVAECIVGNGCTGEQSRTTHSFIVLLQAVPDHPTTTQQLAWHESSHCASGIVFFKPRVCSLLIHSDAFYDLTCVSFVRMRSLRGLRHSVPMRSFYLIFKRHNSTSKYLSVVLACSVVVFLSKTKSDWRERRTIAEVIDTCFHVRFFWFIATSGHDQKRDRYR